VSFPQADFCFKEQLDGLLHFRTGTTFSQSLWLSFELRGSWLPRGRRPEKARNAAVPNVWRGCISTRHQWTPMTDTSLNSRCNVILNEIIQVKLDQLLSAGQNQDGIIAWNMVRKVQFHSVNRLRLGFPIG
jgi:hypothetical protein